MRADLPLAGQMPGRAEGGAVPPTCQSIAATPTLIQSEQE